MKVLQCNVLPYTAAEAPKALTFTHILYSHIRWHLSEAQYIVRTESLTFTHHATDKKERIRQWFKIPNSPRVNGTAIISEGWRCGSGVRPSDRIECTQWRYECLMNFYKLPENNMLRHCKTFTITLLVSICRKYIYRKVLFTTNWDLL